jgi:5-methylcytosine-specific restriction endonuclease McrA
VELICNTHGISEHKKKTRSTGEFRWVCKACEYLSSRKYLANLKLKAIKYGGGECQKCGYDKCWKALHFHHIDPSLKEFGIFESRAGFPKSRSWPKMQKEIDKCILLCANCHAEIHDNGNTNMAIDKKLNLDRTSLYLINKSILSGRKTPQEIMESI